VTWLNELKPIIKFTSPEGVIFEALWRQNERSFEKKLGISSIPNFYGDIVEDLNSNSTMYPLTVYFQGPFHHKEADSFFLELSNSVGQWEVVHPTKGVLSLQLISAREIINPTENGNYTEFDTSWIEPANKTNLISFEELASSIISRGLNLVDDCQVLLTQLRTDTYAAIQATIKTFNKITGFMDATIKQLAITDALIQDSYLSAKSALLNAINNYSIDNTDIAPVGAAMAALAVIPVSATTDFNTRFSSYDNLTTKTLTLSPLNTTEEDYNTVLVQEFGLTMGLLAIGSIVSDSDYQSRDEIISAIEKMTTIFNSSVDAMDLVQDNFATLTVDKQYYSQSTIYTSLAGIYSDSINYLLSQFYNLKSEKRFTLKKARSPIEITVTEKGELNFETEYDIFIKSNNLNGNDILLIPAGREVLFYVG